MHFYLVAAVFAATGAGFMNTNAGQFREKGFELLPDPLDEDFAGWVFQARDVVEVVVIQLFIERLEDGFDLGEVANPAGIGVNLALDIDGDPKRMAMQAPAFMAFRDVRQAVGGLEHKLFEQFQGDFSLVVRGCQHA